MAFDVTCSGAFSCAKTTPVHLGGTRDRSGLRAHLELGHASAALALYKAAGPIFESPIASKDPNARVKGPNMQMSKPTQWGSDLRWLTTKAKRTKRN